MYEASLCVLYYQMGHELFGQCNCGGGLAAIGKHVNQAAAKTDIVIPRPKPLLVPDSEMAALFRATSSSTTSYARLLAARGVGGHQTG